MQNWINSKLIAMQAWAIEKSEAREEGQGTVEYAVVLGVLVVAIYTAFVAFDIAQGVENAVEDIVDVLP